MRLVAVLAATLALTGCVAGAAETDQAQSALDGQVALAAAAGEPHVLWFWADT